jgi:hypothetical protein
MEKASKMTWVTVQAIYLSKLHDESMSSTSSMARPWTTTHAGRAISIGMLAKSTLIGILGFRC